MSKLILINSTPEETRVAIVENRALAEIHFERARDRGIAGNIYKGKVVRVLPGMQAAFVDIGLAKAGFLHASDFHPGGDALPIVDAEPPERDADTAPPLAAPEDCEASTPADAAPEATRIVVRASASVTTFLYEEEGSAMDRLEREIGRRITVETAAGSEISWLDVRAV